MGVGILQFLPRQELEFIIFYSQTQSSFVIATHYHFLGKLFTVTEILLSEHLCRVSSCAMLH